MWSGEPVATAAAAEQQLAAKAYVEKIMQSRSWQEAEVRCTQAAPTCPLRRVPASVAALLCVQDPSVRRGCPTRFFEKVVGDGITRAVADELVRWLLHMRLLVPWDTSTLGWHLTRRAAAAAATDPDFMPGLHGPAVVLLWSGLRVCRGDPSDVAEHVWYVGCAASPFHQFPHFYKQGTMDNCLDQVCTHTSAPSNRSNNAVQGVVVLPTVQGGQRVFLHQNQSPGRGQGTSLPPHRQLPPRTSYTVNRMPQSYLEQNFTKDEQETRGNRTWTLKKSAD
jgi:hypothetical protein